ncbi:MAG: alanine--tRNA ligase [Verrucomicrobiota bacterium]
MTSAEIRQSFLDFFRSKQHTLVPSSSLMPDSPNLLFTNAGMNQFVPIFLGERKADVSKWGGAVAGSDTRAADTQKCIRAGGKHNDLDDVGLDTYHHTFFEMLGNWSFGDYFKKEAIDWAWELVVEIWKFPAERLYATIYNPDKSKGDPSERDEEAWGYWAEKFRARGLDPAVHIVNGNKKDNFWMMGETGPCGPCSELHVDLTPAGDTRGALVNQGSAECIEIWNLVFIQFNANPDGSFSPLPAKHVDTGMGFERVTSILQGTKGFTDFVNARISNYETDIFRPIFDEIEKLSGKRYGSTLPKAGTAAGTEQEKIDIAFRVIGDHIRTLSFAVADGIQPGNSDRNYVLRRILRRAVRYGRTLGFHEPFFYKLVDVLAKTMGDVFPEIRAKQAHVKDVLRLEEEAFNRTLDRGIRLFENEVLSTALTRAVKREGLDWSGWVGKGQDIGVAEHELSEFSIVRNGEKLRYDWSAVLNGGWREFLKGVPEIGGEHAFSLYDTYGFPLDLTELMARERGLTVDKAGFEKLMEEQRARARAAQKKTVIELSQIETKTPTRFIGYDALETPATVLDVVELKDKVAVILDASTCYAEMGGQIGDTADLVGGGQLWRITNTQKSGHTWLHFLETENLKLETPPAAGASVTLSVHPARRNAIQRHHTVTHLLHWAIHEVVSRDASQKGSSVTPEKLTFDFNCAPLSPQQVVDVERLVNERILENGAVSWTEVPYADVKPRRDVMQFFGDKYGDVVRVVQIGGRATQLDGYSMELCGGTHTRATGEIGLFRIVSENAIAAGVRRIEAVAGLQAYAAARHELDLLRSVAGRLTAPVAELEKKVEALLAHQKELEKQVRIALQRNASNAAAELLTRGVPANGIPLITHNLGDCDAEFLQAVADALKGRFAGVVVLGGGSAGSVSLIASVSAEFTGRVQAGKIIQAIAPIVGGKGGGKPDNARGGGKDATRLDEALAKVRTLLG